VTGGAVTGGIHRRRPGADRIAACRGEPAIDLGDGIWMSPGLSNSYLLATDDGRVILNTGMGFEGPLHERAYAGVADGPVRAIILTQGHYDHVGGVDVLREDDTEVVAQADFAVWRADNERLEAFRARNAAFAWMDAIVAAMEYASSSGVGAAAQARPEPTTTFDDRLDLTIGGRRLELRSVPGGETTDALVVWLPDDRTVFTGNLTGPLFGHVPNLVTIRGDRYRDALAYVSSLDVVRDLRPERLVTGHFDPIEGVDRIEEELTAMRDSMQWVHDRTVDGMNAGTDVHTLMRDVVVPERFDVGEGYGKTSWNVRAIWETYAGWFHHRSTTELYPVPPSAVSGDVVAAAGADALVAAARAHLDAGRPVEALHLTDLVLAAEPASPPARSLAAAASRALLESSSNFWESAWLRRAIDRLEAAP
jgi:alkyl sulfatase BDS1-like metallo-beta-lactamase superfamily hydrolase